MLVQQLDFPGTRSIPLNKWMILYYLCLLLKRFPWLTVTWMSPTFHCSWHDSWHRLKRLEARNYIFHFKAGNLVVWCDQTTIIPEHRTTLYFPFHVYQLHIHARLCMKSWMFVWYVSFWNHRTFSAYFCEQTCFALNESIWSKSELLFSVHQRNGSCRLQSNCETSVTCTWLLPFIEVKFVLSAFFRIRTMCWLKCGTDCFQLATFLYGWRLGAVWLIISCCGILPVHSDSARYDRGSQLPAHNVHSQLQSKTKGHSPTAISCPINVNDSH